MSKPKDVQVETVKSPDYKTVKIKYVENMPHVGFDAFVKSLEHVVNEITLPAISISSKKGMVKWDSIDTDLPRNEWEMLKLFSIQDVYAIFIRGATIAATTHMKAYHDVENTKATKLPASYVEAVKPHVAPTNMQKFDKLELSDVEKQAIIDDLTRSLVTDVEDAA